MRRHKEEVASHVLKNNRRSLRCPVCGRRLMDISQNTKARFILSSKGQYPDFLLKCGHCGAEVGVSKTE